MRQGADRLVLCDSNGACFPHEVFSITQTVVREYGGKVGAHFHNDVGCAVANCTTAVRAGATQIQGNYLGLGERCGDVQLSVVIPNLQLKSGYSCIPNSKMELVTRVASFIAETANINIPANMPYLGRNAFAHKDIDSCGGKSALRPISPQNWWATGATCSSPNLSANPAYWLRCSGWTPPSLGKRSRENTWGTISGRWSGKGTSLNPL